MGEARDVMDRATEASINQDWETLASLYAPDAVITDPQLGTLTGRVVEYFKSLSDAFPDIRYHLETGHEAGNVAIDEGYVTGTHTGSLVLPDQTTIPATGRSIRVRSCDVMTVENGVATRHNIYWDQLELLSQLGLAPEAAQT